MFSHSGVPFGNAVSVYRAYLPINYQCCDEG
jgi:hypothetical protein